MNKLNEMTVERPRILTVKDPFQKCAVILPMPKGMKWNFEGMGENGVLISTLDGFIQVVMQPETVREIFEEDEDD